MKDLDQLRKENAERVNRITNPEGLPNNYDVYYKYDPFFAPDSNVTKDNFMVSHCYVMSIFAKDVEEVFRVMQGEHWSPEGEAREFIKTAGLQHTSMSVGDIIKEISTNRVWECDIVGWIEKITTFEKKEVENDRIQ